MARFSTHTLDGVDGTHAGGIAITLTHVGDEINTIFTAQTDKNGRLSEDIDLSGTDPDVLYELVFRTGPYWAARDLPSGIGQVIPEIVLRFRMKDPHGKYHMPLIFSPNSYSTWTSG